MLLAVGCAAVACYCAFRVQDEGLGARGVWRRATAPAVMYAFGEGFHNPDLPAESPFFDFVASRKATLERSELPEHIGKLPPDLAQRRWWWLLMPVAVWWSMTGVIWPALAR